MATRIRLARYGGKKTPFYRIVVADKRRARDGRFIEIIGHYDPQAGLEQATVKAERAQYWLKQGAEPSDTVRQLFRKKLAAA